MKSFFPNVAKLALDGHLSNPNLTYSAYERLRYFVLTVDGQLCKLLFSKCTTCFNPPEYEHIKSSLNRNGNFLLPHEVYIKLSKLDNIAEATTSFLFKALMEVVTNFHLPNRVFELKQITGMFNKNTDADLQQLLEFGIVLFFPELERCFNAFQITKHFSITKEIPEDKRFLSQDFLILYKGTKIVLSPYDLLPAITETMVTYDPKSGNNLTEKNIFDSDKKVRRKSSLYGALGPSSLKFQFFSRRILDIITNHVNKEAFNAGLNKPPNGKQDGSSSSMVNYLDFENDGQLRNLGSAEVDGNGNPYVSPPPSSGNMSDATVEEDSDSNEGLCSSPSPSLRSVESNKNLTPTAHSSSNLFATPYSWGSNSSPTERLEPDSTSNMESSPLLSDNGSIRDGNSENSKSQTQKRSASTRDGDSENSGSQAQKRCALTRDGDSENNGSQTQKRSAPRSLASNKRNNNAVDTTLSHFMADYPNTSKDTPPSNPPTKAKKRGRPRGSRNKRI